MALVLKASARPASVRKAEAHAPLVDGTTVTMPMTSPLVQNGAGSLTHSRASGGPSLDWEGLLITAISGEIRVEGARGGRNLASGYSTQSITVVSGNDYQVTIEGDNGDTCVASNAFTGTLTANGTNRISWNSGTPNTAATTTLTLTITGTLTKLLVEDVTGKSNQNPSENIDSATDYGYGVNGVNNYLHQNGTTVDGSGNVTEARGSDITGAYTLLEKAADNIALYSRDYTQADWVTTNITPVKDATGVDGVPNSASTLTADAGNGTCFQTVTIGSAERTTSFYVKRKTGTGTIEITDNDGTNYTDITSDINSSTWSRVDITRTQANPVFGFRIVTSGDEIEVDFSQLEAGVKSTSPVETTSGTASRAADLCTYPVPGNMLVNDFWIIIAYKAKEDSGFNTGDAWWSLLGMNESGGDRIHLYLSGTTLAPTVQKKTGGVSRAVTNANAQFPFSKDDKLIIAGRFSRTQGITCFSKNVTTDASIVTSTSDTTAEAKADSTLDNAFGLGRDTDALVTLGVHSISNIKIYPHDATDDEISGVINDLAGRL